MQRWLKNNTPGLPFCCAKPCRTTCGQPTDPGTCPRAGFALGKVLSRLPRLSKQQAFGLQTEQPSGLAQHGAAGDTGRETGLSFRAAPWPRLQAGGTHCSPHPAARHLLGWIYRVTYPGNPGDPQHRGAQLWSTPRICIAGVHNVRATQDLRHWGAQGPVSTRVPGGPTAQGYAAPGHPEDPKPGGVQHRGTPA